MSVAPPHVLILYAAGSITADRLEPMLPDVAADLTFLVPERTVFKPEIEIPVLRRWGEVVPVRALDEVPEVAQRLAKRRPVDGVLTISELLVRTAAALSERLGVRGHSVATAERLSNKKLQRQALQAHGVLTPRFTTILDVADVERAIAEVGVPAVLKPARGMGSTLTFPITRAGDLRARYAEARSLHASDPKLAGEGPSFVLEEMLIGDQWYDTDRYGDYVSVESLLVDGAITHLTITDKLPLAKPFRETGYIAPSSLAPTLQRDILDMTTAALRAVGVQNGAAHTELKLTARGPRIIEVNGRLGAAIGDLLWFLGYNVFANMVRAAVGETPQHPKLAGHAYLLTPRTPADDVIVQSIEGLSAIAALPGVRRVFPILAVGDSPKWRLGEGAVVSIMGHADAVNGVFRVHDEVRSLLQVSYAPAEA